MSRGPLVPLFLVYSPELLLLARCLWDVRDAVRARSLVTPDEFPGLGRVCFQLLTSPERPVPDELTHEEINLVRHWLVAQDCRLHYLVDTLAGVPFACMDLVSLADCVQAMRWPETSGEAPLAAYPALTTWRDLVLSAPRRVSRIARAAALELAALEATLAGDKGRADGARQAAREAVVRRTA